MSFRSPQATAKCGSIVRGKTFPYFFDRLPSDNKLRIAPHHHLQSPNSLAFMTGNIFRGSRSILKTFSSAVLEAMLCSLTSRFRILAKVLTLSFFIPNLFSGSTGDYRALLRWFCPSVSANLSSIMGALVLCHTELALY